MRRHWYLDVGIWTENKKAAPFTFTGAAFFILSDTVLFHYHFPGNHLLAGFDLEQVNTALTKENFNREPEKAKITGLT